MRLLLAPLCWLLMAATEPALSDRLARLDALHARRDDPAALAEARRIADAAVAEAPNDHRVLWRAAPRAGPPGRGPAPPPARTRRRGGGGDPPAAPAPRPDPPARPPAPP